MLGQVTEREVSESEGRVELIFASAGVSFESGGCSDVMRDYKSAEQKTFWLIVALNLPSKIHRFSHRIPTVFAFHYIFDNWKFKKSVGSDNSNAKTPLILTVIKEALIRKTHMNLQHMVTVQMKT